MAQDLVPASWEDVVTAAAKANGVNPALALAVAKKESSLKPDAVGDSGQAVGMFQLHQGAAVDTGTPNRADPIQNITGGVKYLRQLSDRYKGDVQKALMAYNGGMEGVDAGTPSPAAQAYAADVIANLSASVRPAAPEAKPTFTDESKPLSARTKSLERRANKPEPTTAADLVGGAVRGAVSTVQTLASPIRKAFGMEPATPPPAETTTLGKVGRFAEQAAEFAVPAGVITKGAKAANLAQKLTAKGAPLLAARLTAGGVEAAAQGAAAYGVSKTQGASETGSRINAALGAIGPAVSTAMPALGQAIRDRAVTQLARRLSKGLAEPNPAVEYGLKTGDVAPDAKDAVRIVRQAASDILDAPIRMTWGKWLASLSKDSAQKGEALGNALKGPLGDVPLLKQPIYDELDKLAQQSAQHFFQIKGGAKTAVYNPDLLKATEALKEMLDQYGPTIPVRYLSDIKRSWDDIVYTLSTSGKVGLGSEALLNSAKKQAASTGANAIRHIFDQKAPTIDALNEAVSHAYRLQDLAQKVFLKQPGPGAMGQVALGTAGSVGGFLAGQTVGHPYVVMGMGAAASRALVKALQSPLFQTLSPALKNKLATAVATGQSGVVQQILAPIISAGVSTKTQKGATVP